MRKLFYLTLFCLAATGLTLPGPTHAKTLKIASLSPLTGPYAADGNDIVNGVKTAITVIQAQGGLPGISEIKLFPQDSSCDPRQAVAAANKILNLGVTAVIGAYCSSSTIPASETLDEDSIIMITPASTNEKVTERGLKYMFRMCGRDDDQSIVAVKFMTDYLKAKTLFIVDDKTTYSQGLADNVEKVAIAQGIKVIKHDHVNQGDKDFSAVLTKIKQAKPDVFYMSLQNSSTGSLMAIQAKRFGIKAKIIAQDAVYHPQFIKIAKQAAEGVFLTFGYIDKNSPAYQEFYKPYKAKYGEPGAYSGYAYDSAMALFKAIKACNGDLDPNKIRAALLKLDYPGATKHIKFKPNGDSGSNYIVRQVKNGQFVNFWNPATGQLY